MKPRYAFLLAVLLGIAAYALAERLRTSPAEEGVAAVPAQASRRDTEADGERPRPATSPTPPRVFVSDEMRFEDVIFTRIPFGEYKVTLKFPQLARADGVDPKSVRAFDRAARAAAYAQLRWVPASLKDAGHPAGFTGVGYEVTYATSDFVSVTFTACSICCHAGTAGCEVRVLNYDLRNRRELSPRDIFKPRSDYARALAGHSEPELTRRYGGMFLNLKSDKEKLKMYDRLGVTPGGLRVIFDEYEVAPGSAGTPDVLVPYHLIRDKLNPRTPVAELAR